MARAKEGASSRLGYVDLFRGLLIAHMAFDHASMFFNANRWGEELAAKQPDPPVDLGQFLARFSGVAVAPGFFFMAGFMVALTSAAREKRGVSSAEVTRRLVIRGLVLFLVDQTIMSVGRIPQGFVSFAVLSAIGLSLIVLALSRRLPENALLLGGIGILALHPLLDLSALPTAVRGVLYDPIREGFFRSLYPVVPWVGVLVVGYVVGRDSLTRERPRRFWIGLGLACFALFFAIRLLGGYGNAYPHAGLGSLDFWFFAKYPPDLAWLSWSFAQVFLGLAVLHWVTESGVPRVLSPFVVLGRVPFFFYIVHFYVFGFASALVGGKLGVGGTLGMWALGVALLLWPCAWYYRKKRERPNLITRYV